VDNDHILVIDDDPSVRFFVEEALRRIGYTVVGVATAEEALARLANQPPALMIIDLQLTGMSGTKLLEKLHGAGGDVPSIVLTAHGVPFNAREALALGALDFLPKPCTTADLRAAVAGALDPAHAAHHRRAFLDSLVRHPEQSVDQVRQEVSSQQSEGM
jgi:DNA-binding NtrC family response regulator